LTTNDCGKGAAHDGGDQRDYEHRGHCKRTGAAARRDLDAETPGKTAVR
jgi:hypothetical protein